MKRLQTTYSKFIFYGPAVYSPHPSIETNIYRIRTANNEINLLPAEAIILAKSILATYCAPPKE